MTMEEMTLIHHVAFDGYIEVMEMLTALPYFKEIVDSDNNEVRVSWLVKVPIFRWDGHLCCGLLQEEILI